jgi:glutamate-1-semialdehyde 2,1-aminomutase
MPSILNRVGSMMTVFFTPDPVRDFTTAMKADTERYATHYRQMLSQGIYFAPSQFEVTFVSAAQTDDDLRRTIEMTEWSFKKILEM